jgi:hypothetical protein
MHAAIFVFQSISSPLSFPDCSTGALAATTNAMLSLSSKKEVAWIALVLVVGVGAFGVSSHPLLVTWVFLLTSALQIGAFLCQLL